MAKRIAHNPSQLGCNVPLPQVTGPLIFAQTRETGLSSGFPKKEMLESSLQLEHLFRAEEIL